MPVAAPLQFFRQRWLRWLDRRIPRQREVTLNQRRIFIFLSGQGLVTVFILLALFVAGINYGNNLLLGLSFFLASVFVVAIHHTYANLSGLRITALAAEPAFAGAEAAFRLRLDDSRGRRHDSLLLQWETASVRLPGLESVHELTLWLPTHERGWRRPGRLKLSSTYPLGWLRAWTWLDLDLAALVYPQPEACAEPPLGGIAGSEGRQRQARGQEDFQGLRRFVPGDAQTHIAWAQLARGRGLLTKHYAGEQQGRALLDWEALAGLPLETRLSRLCWWVEQLAAQEQAFGLRLPGLELAPATGAAQRAACLRALALFGRPESPP